MGFPRQDYCSGLSFSSLGDLPDPRTEPASPALVGGFFTTKTPGKPGSTYLRTPNGQEVTIPNSNMLHAVVTNFTRLNKRRVNYDVGVAYDTDIELAKKVLLDLVKNDELILPKEECTVYVYELGSYSVGLRIRCWTKFNDYWPFYNALSEKVLLAFRENGIRIPSSTDIQVDKRN